MLILAKDFVKCAFGHFSIAIGKLKTVDDAFRHQLESKEMKHREDMAQLEEERQMELERANQRVRQISSKTDGARKIQSEGMTFKSTNQNGKEILGTKLKNLDIFVLPRH